MQRSLVVCQLLGYEPGVHRLKHDARELHGPCRRRAIARSRLRWSNVRYLEAVLALADNIRVFQFIPLHPNYIEQVSFRTKREGISMESSF